MNERDLFLAAIEIPDAAARAKYVEQQCAGDPKLRVSVEALLQLHVNPGSFMAEPLAQLTPPEILPPTDVAPSPPTLDHPRARPGVPDDTTRPFSPRDPDGRAAELLEPSTVPGSMGRLDHYEVHEILGSGGFGTVLRAFDDKLHRMVAIKIMSAQLAATSPARKRFLREARAAAAVRHEHVVQIYAVEEHPLPYLVMEFIPGQTLEQRLVSHGPLDNTNVLRLGYQIASGLAAAHEMGIIHRDIKPANIMLERGINERVKLTDFGLARAVDDASLTQSGMVAGTPMYMSPEQAHGQTLDQRSDLFSLGSVLYQMVSGRPPFRASSTVAVLQRVAESAPRPIQEIIPETPEWLIATIARLHARNPEDRIQTARELADLLRQFEKDLEQGRVPQVPWRQPSPPVSAQPAVGASATRSRPVSGSRYRLPLVAVVSLVLMLVGIGLTEATGVTGFSSSLVRLAFGEGVLVIESNDPNLRIKVDDNEMTISGGGISELKLRPGTHTITATRNGTTVKQELVQIFRDGRQVLKVGIEPAVADAEGIPKSASPETKEPTPELNTPQGPIEFREELVDYKAERAAAEWVLSVGGQLGLRKFQFDGTEVDFAVVDGKLPEGEFLIGGVTLDQTKITGHRLTDEDLGRFQKCVGLMGFSITSAVRVTARGINQLPSTNRFGLLVVSSMKVDPAQINWARWPNLDRLWTLHQPPDGWIQALNESPRLTWLQVGDYHTSLSAAAMKTVRRHESLKVLELYGASPAAADCRELFAKLPNVEEFVTSAADGKALSTSLPELKRLRSLRCDSPAIDEHVVTSLQTCPGFRTLMVNVIDVNGLTLEKLRLIGQLEKQLRTLNLVVYEPQPSSFTMEAQQELASLKELEELNIHFDSAGKADISGLPNILKQMPKLKRVTLGGASFTRFANELTAARPDVHFLIEGQDYPATQMNN